VTTLWDLIAQQAREQPDRVAFEHRSHQLTWSGFAVEVEAATAAFARWPAGQRVGFRRPQPITYLAGCVAAARTGAAVAALATPAIRREVAAVAEAFDLDEVLSTDDPGFRWDEAARFADNPRGANREGADRARLEDAPLLHFSSGSTGQPKAIPRPQANLIDEAQGVARSLALQPDDAFVHSSPAFHSFTGGLVWAAALAGSKSIFLDGLQARAGLTHCLGNPRPILTGVPYQFALMARLTGVEGREPRRRLRAICGGAPLTQALALAFRARFGADIVHEYGLSEAGVVSLNLRHAALKPTSVGAPVAGVRLRLDLSGGDPDIGEVLVSRRHLPPGYLDQPGDPAFAEPGWVRTGDLGRIDADGDLHLVGRLKQMINVAGNKVAPGEVATCLAAVEGVADIAVFGLPDRDTGEAVAAVVTIDPDAADDVEMRERLVAASRLALASHKQPTRIVFRPEMPRLPSGKVDIGALVKSLQV
jgi:long-chain acyl-CoA synthetase